MDEPKSETLAPTKKGGMSVALIIIIIVAALIVLGVAGWFLVKHFSKSDKSTSGNPTATATVVAGQISVKTVEDALLYPGAKITDQEHDKDSAYKSTLILDSVDSAKTVYDYYIKLASTNKYTVSRQGSRDANNYYLTITTEIFTAEIDATKYEGYDTTEILIKISGDKLVSDGISVSATVTATSGTTAAPSTTVSATAISGAYIFSNSNTVLLAESDLTALTPWQLKVARNEIYARHGREFAHRDLQCYFAKKSWYTIDANYSESSLSTIENQNVATIQAYENKTNSPLANSDSGCDTNW